MSGTPRFITPWAPDANYPTGTGFAWQGTPTKVTPAYVEFQPSPAFAPSAQEFNSILNGLGVVINLIGADVQAASFVTWQPSYVLNMLGAITPSCVAWDSIALKWLVGGLNTTPAAICATGRGDPLNWSESAGGPSTLLVNPTAVCRGIEPGVSNKYVYLATASGGISLVVRGDTVGLGWATVGLPFGGTADATSVAMISVSGAIVLAVGASSSAHTGILHSIDHGATWQAGPAPGVAVAQWLLAQSVPGAGTIMAIPQIAAGGGGTLYYTSTDGLTWTTQAGLQSLPLATTETPFGLTYGADGVGTPCWILATHDSAGGGATKTYRSYNGASWASFANNIPAGMALFQLSASGQQLIGSYFEAAPARILCSLDGGATWATTNLELIGTVAGAGTCAGPNQFLAFSNVLMAASPCYGSPGGIGAQ